MSPQTGLNCTSVSIAMTDTTVSPLCPFPLVSCHSVYPVVSNEDFEKNPELCYVLASGTRSLGNILRLGSVLSVPLRNQGRE